MTHDVRQWPPDRVYPREVVAECPEAAVAIDSLLRQFRIQGPEPDGYTVKRLGLRVGGLWQINLKIKGRQVRVLYAPYGVSIVLFRIHRKSSPQEQGRAYDLAKDRKRDFERQMKGDGNGTGNRTYH